MRSTRFDAVLFDFSGVMVSSAFDALARLGDASERERTLELLLGPYHEDTDHPWHRVERGELAIDAWVTEVAATATSEGVEIDWSVLGTLLGDLEPFPQMEVEARRLRADGYRVGLVTNNVKEGSAAWRKLVPVDELFEVVVDSSEVGLRKPDARIYELTCERIGVAPDASVFIDDNAENIAAARALGMETVHFGENPFDAVAELDAILERRGVSPRT